MHEETQYNPKYLHCLSLNFVMGKFAASRQQHYLRYLVGPSPFSLNIISSDNNLGRTNQRPTYSLKCGL